MEVRLNKDSVIDERTGEVQEPSEYLMNLRELERQIARYDDEIGELQATLKAAKNARENSVAALRAAVREGKVLPLLEVAEREDDGWGDQPDESPA